jgi:hypothetical protein
MAGAGRVFHNKNYATFSIGTVFEQERQFGITCKILFFNILWR